MLKARNFLIFGRATASNFFLVTKLLCALSNSLCTWTLTTLTSECSSLLYEDPCGTRLARMTTSGLIHLFVLQLVTRFMSFRAVERPFPQTFLRVHLTAHLLDVMASMGSAEGVGVWGLNEVRDSVHFFAC